MSQMIIHLDVEQNTEAWHRLRLGLPTASNFSAILAKGEGKTRRSYLYRLAGEIVTGEPTEAFSNGALERGHAMEPDARNFYALLHDVEPERVGFITNGPKGCSPDSLIGDDGMLEIKTQRSDLLVDTILADKFPSEHIAQTQGNLWVAEREWIDLVVFWPKMPPFTKRAYRDEMYISKLAMAVADFNAELAEVVTRIRAYGMAA